MAELARTGPLDAPVAACPGWDLRELVVHVGRVHRWAREAVVTAAPPGELELAAPGDPEALAAWVLEGADALVAALTATAPDAPTWHFFAAPKVAGVWRRRQAHETLIHRHDAEAALGLLTPLDPALAADGIDEYFGLIVPRVLQRAGRAAPESSLHVHCTDTHGEWLLRTVDGSPVLTREHAKGDAALRGGAEALLLRLWARTPTGPVEVVGDPAAAEAWLALGGN